MKITAILLLFLLVFPGCHDEISPSGHPSDLLGKWEWEFSTGGIAGTIYTPESTGDRVLIEFGPDSVYREYRNDVLIFENLFHVIRSETIYREEPAEIIVIDDLSVRQSFELHDQCQLILYDEIYDGFVHQYSKIYR